MRSEEQELIARGDCADTSAQLNRGLKNGTDLR